MEENVDILDASDRLIADIREWVGEDVSIEQVKSVFWGIMMSNSEGRVDYQIKRAREEYKAGRRELDG